MKLMVIIDMQNDFLTGTLGNPGTQAVLAPVCLRIKNALESGVELLCTMDTHGEDYMETTEGRKLPVPHCIKGTKGWELPDELKDALGGLVPERQIEKGTFGAKNLPEKVIEVCRGVPDEIELIGVCTDICVISNALLLKTFFPECEITVNAGCCAGTSPEAHDRAIEAMKMCQINII